MSAGDPQSTGDALQTREMMLMTLERECGRCATQTGDFTFDTPKVLINGEPMVGLTVSMEGATECMSWNETVALHKWLGEFMEASKNGR